MSRSSVTIGFVVAIVLQILVLSGMVVKASLPLWIGNEIKVKTVPIDPRSMFRGNYARLNYEIGRLPKNALGKALGLRKGEIVYVTLELKESGLYEFSSASLDKPKQGVFLRGRITNNHPPYQVKYGIEAFFAPKEKALRLEQELRNGGLAVLMVAGSGKVTLKDVVPSASN